MRYPFSTWAQLFFFLKECVSQTSIYIWITWRQNTKAHSQSFWLIRSEVAPDNLHFCQVHSWLWCYWPGDHTLRTMFSAVSSSLFNNFLFSWSTFFKRKLCRMCICMFTFYYENLQTYAKIKNRIINLTHHYSALTINISGHSYFICIPHQFKTFQMDYCEVNSKCIISSVDMYVSLK